MLDKINELIDFSSSTISMRITTFQGVQPKEFVEIPRKILPFRVYHYLNCIGLLVMSSICSSVGKLPTTSPNIYLERIDLLSPGVMQLSRYILKPR